MGSLEDRLRKIEQRVIPEPSRNPHIRARMKRLLDEVAATRREGRAPSPEARAVGEAIERRRARGN